jgi:hypothetical protein
MILNESKFEDIKALGRITKALNDAACSIQGYGVCGDPNSNSFGIYLQNLPINNFYNYAFTNLFSNLFRCCDSIESHRYNIFQFSDIHKYAFSDVQKIGDTAHHKVHNAYSAFINLDGTRNINIRWLEERKKLNLNTSEEISLAINDNPPDIPFYGIISLEHIYHIAIQDMYDLVEGVDFIITKLSTLRLSEQIYTTYCTSRSVYDASVNRPTFESIYNSLNLETLDVLTKYINMNNLASSILIYLSKKYEGEKLYHVKKNKNYKFSDCAIYKDVAINKRKITKIAIHLYDKDIQNLYTDSEYRVWKLNYFMNNEE